MSAPLMHRPQPHEPSIPIRAGDVEIVLPVYGGPGRRGVREMIGRVRTTIRATSRRLGVALDRARVGHDRPVLIPVRVDERRL